MSVIQSMDKKMPILIVDDFATMRKIVKKALKDLGFENVTEAEDGAIALSKLDGGNFSFIISDWNMPNMMGIDLLKAVRGNEQTKTIPFLMITAEAQKDNLVEAAKAGVSNYMMKPFTSESLQQKIEAIFAKKNT